MDFHSSERNELIDYDNLCDYKIFKVVFTGTSRFAVVGGLFKYHHRMITVRLTVLNVELCT